MPRTKLFKPKTCPVCNTEFIVNTKSKISSGKKTCSLTCAAKLPHLTKNHTAVCSVCEISIATTTSGKNRKDLVCSEACRNQKYKRNCNVCNIEYYPDRHNTKYCSDVCKHVGVAKNKVKLVCTHCEESFERKAQGYFPDKERNFCSRRCANAYFSRFYYGEEGKYGKDWYFIRKAVVNRDGKKCVACLNEFEKYRGIHVHHIVPFSKFSSKAEANQLHNLVTLCKACHNHIHSKKYDGRYDSVFKERYSPSFAAM